MNNPYSLIQNSFQVTIDGSAAASLASPSDGFIDKNEIQQYISVDANNTPILDGIVLANSIAKARANVRFITLVQQMQRLGNLDLSNYVFTGATAVAAPTTVSFTVRVEHGLTTVDENDGVTVLYGKDALIRSIARSLIVTQNLALDYMDPTKVASAYVGPINNYPVQRRFFQLQRTTIGQICPDLATATALIGVVNL